MTASTELWRIYRPASFAGVIGQKDAVDILTGKLQEKTLPHTTLLIGPSGVGKTTIAYLLADALGCTDIASRREINCADVRGIDSVREIMEEMRFRSLSGGDRIWILDEVVQLPKVTQQAFLKLLEEPPDHAYFVLCTTSTEGLLPTFLSRCFPLRLRNLTERSLHAILIAALKKLEINEEYFPDTVLERIVELANGSARSALVLLELVLVQKDDPEQMLKLLGGYKLKEETEFLVNALMRQAAWPDITKSIDGIQDADVENLRWRILKCCATIMLSSRKLGTLHMANLVIKAFADSWRESGRAGLLSACWDVCQKKQNF